MSDTSALASERVEFPSRSGRILVGDLHRANGGNGCWLVLCHGMESTRGGKKQTAIARRLVPAGYSVLRFDFSFVGDSDGRFEDMTISGEVADALGALDFVYEFNPLNVCLVGSSLGGLVALLATAREPHLVHRIATIAALADTALFTRGLSDAERKKWRSEGRRDWGDAHLNSTFLDDVESLDAPAELARMDAPILIMHGQSDSVVPVEHASMIAATVASQARLELFEGVDHRFEEPGALHRLLGILEEWLEGKSDG